MVWTGPETKVINVGRKPTEMPRSIFVRSRSLPVRSVLAGENKLVEGWCGLRPFQMYGHVEVDRLTRLKKNSVNIPLGGIDSFLSSWAFHVLRKCKERIHAGGKPLGMETAIFFHRGG